MTALSLLVLQVAVLALLWLLVLAVAMIVRADVFGGSRGTVADGPPSGRERRRRRRDATALVVTKGVLEGTALPLGDGDVLIGRAPGCTLVLDDGYTSARHARIRRDDSGWILEDLNSTNGTSVDGSRITGSVRIQPGSVIEIGDSRLELRR